MNNSNHPLFDEMAADYDRWFDQPDGEIIFASELKALQEVLISLPAPWLEIGVGSGRFAQALGITTGLDPSGKLLDIARTRGILTLKGRIEDISLPLDSFGAVFLIMTMCFLDNPAAALLKIGQILKPGGNLIVADVPADSAWGSLYLQKKRRGHPFYGHANFYTYQEWQDLINQTGFKIGRTISTLRQKPGQMAAIEEPVNGYEKGAGFLVITASKTSTTAEKEG